MLGEEMGEFSSRPYTKLRISLGAIRNTVYTDTPHSLQKLEEATANVNTNITHVTLFVSSRIDGNEMNTCLHAYGHHFEVFL
jgi:hypothetical protein